MCIDSRYYNKTIMTINTTRKAINNDQDDNTHKT